MLKELSPERQRLERIVVRQTVRAFLAEGYSLGLHDGLDLLVTRCKSATVIMNAMFTTNENELFVYNNKGRQVGSVVFCYGNIFGIIVSYDFSFEKLMRKSEELALRFGLVPPRRLAVKPTT